MSDALQPTFRYAERWARERPDAEAVIFGERRLTWGQLVQQVDAAAAALLELGVGPGDRVAVLAMACPEFLTTFLAAGKLGAVWLGLSPKAALPELRYVVEHSRPRVLIALPEYAGADLRGAVAALAEVDGVEATLSLGDAFAGAPAFAATAAAPRSEQAEALAARAAEVTLEDEALLLYTSGSTGKPKGVVHTHGSLAANVTVEVERFGLHPGTRGLIHFPINHVAAVVELGLGLIVCGGSVVLQDRFCPVASLEAIARERVTLVGQVPVMFLLQLKEPRFREVDLSCVEQLVWAGAAAPQVLVDALGALAARTGATLITGYGSTEVAGFVTYTDPGDGPERLLLTAGKVAPPFELRIAGEDGRTLPDGAVGEVLVRGPMLMKGYLHDPDATAAAVDADGWYRTGDLARRDADGYITVAGRCSEMFKTGGENVYPREVEDVLEADPGVLFAAVLGVPDPLYQEVGWAYVVPRPGGDLDEGRLLARCREHLANFKVPKRLFVRAALPLLANGKVDKVALRAEAAQAGG